MRSGCFIVRLFLWGGGLLAVFGLMLWFALPIQLTFPPFLFTALLAMAYGLIHLKYTAKIGHEKKEATRA